MDCWRTRFGAASHWLLSTPLYCVPQPAAYGAPMMTTSAPLRSSREMACGTPKNVGMSSASRGNVLPETKEEERIFSQSG